MTPPLLKTNDRVNITYGGQTVLGSVVLTSSNSKSLMLPFEAMRAGYVGTTPVLWTDELCSYEDLIKWQPVQVVAR